MNNKYLKTETENAGETITITYLRQTIKYSDSKNKEHRETYDKDSEGYEYDHNNNKIYATVNTNGNFPDNLLRIRSTPNTDNTNNNFVVGVPKGESLEILEKT